MFRDGGKRTSGKRKFYGECFPRNGLANTKRIAFFLSKKKKKHAVVRDHWPEHRIEKRIFRWNRGVVLADTRRYNQNARRRERCTVRVLFGVRNWREIRPAARRRIRSF